jgi:ABC-type glycerol-3-phosphate transport system permease component
MTRRKPLLSKGDKAFDYINYIFLSLILATILYPLVYVVSASFSSPAAVMAGRVVLWPVNLSLKGYEAIFSNRQIVTGYGNSIFYTVAGTSLNVALTLMAAYPLSHGSVIMGRKVIMFVFVFTMLFSGGLIPSFLLINQLGMYNTRWAMILPGGLAVWNMLITRTFFITSIPKELYEASEMEGAGELRIFLQIVIPLSATIISVNVLFYAVGHWNSYFNALIYLKDDRLFPLQIILRYILILNQVDAAMLSVEELELREGMKELLKYSLIVVASAPMLIIYPFVQKHFVRGVMIGSIKG